MQFYKKVCITNKHFNNSFSTSQVKMIYEILDNKEIYLHILIKATYK